jgi:hypothetical protein
MRFVLAMVLAGLVALPLSVGAQPAEEDSLSSWQVEAKPAPEPAPEEPALQLELDDAGVEVVPTTPPRTADGYTLEEMELRVKRAKIGLGASAGIFALGLGVALSALACPEPPRDPYEIVVLSECVIALSLTGGVIGTVGLVGMIVTGARLAGRKRDRDWLRQARHGTLRRVQWDLAQSRLVF